MSIPLWSLPILLALALTVIGQAGCMYRHWNAKRRRGPRTWNVPNDVGSWDVSEAYYERIDGEARTI